MGNPLASQRQAVILDEVERLGAVRVSSLVARLGVSDMTIRRDLDALAQANPNLGHRIDPDALLGKATRAKEAGGEQEAKFRTEVMCQSVKTMTPAPITVKDWAARADPASWPPSSTICSA